MRRSAKIKWGLAFLLLCLLGIALVLAHRSFERRALADLADRERPMLALHTENVSSWLGRFRVLAPTYAHDPDVVDLLKDPKDPEKIEAINLRLERWTAASGASDTYILDAQGMALVSSNWNGPVSYVGNSYAFRPYFKDAMQGRLGRYFALGTASGLRGYYFAYPVQDGGRPLGAVVVKVRVGMIEQELRASTAPLFVSDRDGIIILSGHPAWRLKTVYPLSSDTRRRIERLRKFNGASLPPVEIDGLGTDTQVFAAPDRSDKAKRGFLHLSQRMPVEGWTVHLLVESGEARKLASLYTLLLALGIVAAMLVAFVFWQRRQHYLDRLAKRADVQRNLERTGAQRTADLVKTNQRLADEVTERTQAEADLRQTQAELVQAGKLAALGQMSTALSHEFNQPLAAIRSYAENATAFLKRGQAENADENLHRISRLTERMAQLSKHLTAFARKPKDATEPTSLAAALDEAIELLRARIESSGTEIVRDGCSDLIVTGGQVRLQHVFMNLIGNAIDATEGVPHPAIRITFAEQGERAVVTVDDNGHGFADGDTEKLFDPFFSRKEPGKGLGLGLSITYNIIRDFGGTLSAQNRPESGARFTLTLNLAEQQIRAAE